MSEEQICGHCNENDAWNGLDLCSDCQEDMGAGSEDVFTPPSKKDYCDSCHEKSRVDHVPFCNSCLDSFLDRQAPVLKCNDCGKKAGDGTYGIPDSVVHDKHLRHLLPTGWGYHDLEDREDDPGLIVCPDCLEKESARRQSERETSRQQSWEDFE